MTVKSDNNSIKMEEVKLFLICMIDRSTEIFISIRENTENSIRPFFEKIGLGEDIIRGIRFRKLNPTISCNIAATTRDGFRHCIKSSTEVIDVVEEIFDTCLENKYDIHIKMSLRNMETKIPIIIDGNIMHDNIEDVNEYIRINDIFNKNNIKLIKNDEEVKIPITVDANIMHDIPEYINTYIQLISKFKKLYLV